MPDFLTNRSTILDGQKCPRSQWLQYYWDGTGLMRRTQSVPLATGSTVHEGVERLMRGAGEDEAAGQAVAAYRESVTKRALDDDMDGWLAGEQEALAEALVRVHARVCMPQIRAGYEILGVEKDDCRELAEGIGWQFRVDASLRDRATGGLVAYSLKTKSQWYPSTQEEIACDMQGLSEAWGLESAMGEECEYVKMDFLLKGPRKRTGELGRREQMSPLVRAWMSDGVVPKYAWRWEWTDAEGSHRLSPKKWRAFSVWEVMGVREWLDMLLGGGVQPEAGDPVGSLVVAYPPIFRNPRHIDRWKRQVIAQAGRTRFALGEIANVKAVESPELDVLFPQHTQRCHDYSARCPFYEICHGGLGGDPVESGEFMRREPHHSTTLGEDE